ncbi:MAG: AI-2E family transporter [Lentisphaeraceae bacterium]|nr:AI-2E family transporter [Lentisphaeraceae bacterium]
MKKQESKSILSKAALRMTNPVKQALGNVLDSLHSRDYAEDEFVKIKEAVMLLFIYVMKADGAIKDSEVETVSGYFKDKYGQNAVLRFQRLLKVQNPQSIEKSCELLCDFTEGEKENILAALINVAYADGEYNLQEKEVILEIGKALGIRDDVVSHAESEAAKSIRTHSTLVRSGAGVFAALVIIFIFILMATFLKSVLFGIILAYFFLPLQKWYADSFFNNGIVARGVTFVESCFKPFSAFASKVRTIFSKAVPVEKESTMEECEEKKKKALLSRSCHATVLTVALSAVALGVIATWISSTYYTAAKETITEVNEQGKATDETPANYVETFLDRINPDLMKVPFVETSVKKIEEFLADEAQMNDLKQKVNEKFGGVFGIATNVLGGLAAFILNLLLTLFFFSFFLDKMAEFQQKGGQRKSMGDYLVESIFDSGWMPKTSGETQKTAAGIMDAITLKLQTWVRGYLWIIIIESIIYISFFLILGIPYAVILGAIAGLTVLLPFLGPMASALLTMVVCIATGEVSAALLVTILVFYSIMNMVVEQLFLYPAFVGEALGLNTLETIAVVLLGGLMAGLTGVIFAVPAASIIKYLIPKIYNILSENAPKAVAKKSS